MSRRRGEFEHRTSIFEGSYRAWSFLGGIDPEHLFTKTSEELDPLSNPIAPADDTRVKSNATSTQGRPEYPYEPLPRSGLAHPFVQAILSPWLGPDADQDAITLGLTTLRTWWQHRRKGESGSAIAALSTEKMQGIVDGYTRHFFTLAHCLVMNDKEQPPRTLHTKMKAREKQRRKGGAGATSGIAAALGLDSMSESERSRNLELSGSQSQLNNTELTPLERLHAAQQKHYKESEQFGEASIASSFVSANINLKGKCVPGKVDLGSMVDSVNRHAAQLAHRGNEVSSSVNSRGFCLPPANDTHNAIVQYGDPRMTPIVLCNTQGDCQIAMSVDGITCSHCVRIVETVLKGCNGNRSPISGLLDAAADRAMNSVIIKIERPADAKRIAFQAARNLAMVGYTAKALEVKISDENDQPFAQEAICQAFQAAAKGDAPAVFDWGSCCSCPDNGVERRDCPRYAVRR
ncbi:hypothetical protein MPSEU_000371800 [Mayamaea pseudoterrestris]|nr:hypothetical protein MPSEU_000371800 [Mayamaea pseudoterrestris]